MSIIVTDIQTLNMILYPNTRKKRSKYTGTGIENGNLFVDETSVKQNGIEARPWIVGTSMPFISRRVYFGVFKMSRNSFAVTMNGFGGKCFLLPVTRYASSSCFSTTTS